MVSKDSIVQARLPECVQPEALYEKYCKLVKFIIHNSSLPCQLHEDVFNSTFMKITSGVCTIRHTRNLKAWVAKITRNEIIDQLRWIQKSSISLCNGAPLDTYKSTDKTLCEAHLITKEVTSHICKTLCALPPAIATPFWMRYLEGKKWDQISQTLNVKIDTARKRAEKARKILKKSTCIHFGYDNQLPGM